MSMYTCVVAIMLSATHGSLSSTSLSSLTAPNGTGLPTVGFTRATGFTTSKEASSDGLDFELSVFYSLSERPTCTDAPDDQIAVAPGECTCLYHLLGACVASIKLDAAKSNDKTISVQMWALEMCVGKPLLTDYKDWECNSCNVAAIGDSAGIAVEFECPFTAGGICQAVGIEVGENCIIACVLMAVAIVGCCCCCIYRVRANRDPLGLTVQAEYAYVHAHHADRPLLVAGGSE